VPEQPEPTEHEKDADTPSRRDEEDAMRGPGHENPRDVVNPDPDSGDD
jgi:hypothetical protein